MKTFTSLFFSALLSAGLCASTLHAAAATQPHDEQHEARRVTAEAADHALGKNGVHNLLNIVAKSDRDRIEKNLNKDDEKAFQAVADKVREEWKAKYGKEFSASGHVNDLTPLAVNITGQGHNQQAVITFPKETGEGAYDLHLTREKSGWWRIQLPDTVDGASFYKNAQTALEKVEADHDKWPATAEQAYPIVVTEVLKEMAYPAAAK